MSLLGLAALLALVAGVAATDGDRDSSVGTQADEDTPDPIETRVIGISVEQRPIELHCMGDGPRTALFVGGLHTGGEANSAHLAQAFLERLPEEMEQAPDNLRVCIVPMLNPDGLARDEHGNASGVDLNRNWPTADWIAEAYHPTSGTVSAGEAPLSAPETHALYALLVELRPDVLVTWHCCGRLVEPNRAGRADLFAWTYALAADYDYLHQWTAYEITGQLIDAAALLQIPAMDVELTTIGEIDLDDNLAGIRALLAAVATYR